MPQKPDPNTSFSFQLIDQHLFRAYPNVQPAFYVDISPQGVVAHFDVIKSGDYCGKLLDQNKFNLKYKKIKESV